MSRRAFNKKYLNLSNVRIAYRPKDDTIHLTSTDKDLAGEAFKVTLKPGSESDQILRQLLFEKGLINEKSNAEGFLPTHAALKLDSSTPWYSLPKGEGVEGPVSVDSRTTPNNIIAGPTGGGKSVLQRSLIHHCLAHNDQWAVYGVDLKRVELSPYLEYENTVREIATSVSATLQMLSKVKDEMYRRYELMEKQGINNLLDLDDSDPEVGDTKALMIIIDEAYHLFQGADSEGDSEERAKILKLTGEIAKLGRAARVHTVISSQSIEDAGVARLINDFPVKIACGRLNLDASLLLFGDDSATRITSTRGRGLMIEFSEKNFFQSYYSAPSSGEEWVLEHGQNAEPELYKKLLLEG
jgi:hypothetical protein